MPETAAWDLPYPANNDNPDIPRDVQALAEKIDALPIIDPDLGRTGRAAIMVNGTWRQLREEWHYSEKTQRWSLAWYGPRVPHFWPPLALAPSPAWLGNSMTATGGIVDQRSVPITEGTVRLMRQDPDGLSWREVAQTSLGLLSNGSYVLKDPGVTVIGRVSYKVEYAAPNARYESGTSPEVAVEVVVPRVMGLRYVSYTATDCEITWDAVTGADGYEIYNNGTLVKSVAAPPSGRMPIQGGSSPLPRWTVRAFKNDAQGRPVYGPFSVELYVVDTAVAWTRQPAAAAMFGDVVDIGGTVRAANGQPVTVGTVELQMRQTATGAWRVVRNLPVVDGQWSATYTYSHVGAGTVFRAIYVPPLNAAEKTSQADSSAVTVGMSPVGTLNAGTASHTSCTISWSAAPGATRYEIGNGTTVIPGGTLNDATSKSISVAQNTNYEWRVRAGRQDENGTWVYSVWSAALFFNGGRPEQRDQGQAWVHKDCIASGSHRNDATGWGSPYVRQGFFSAPYGGAGYVGIFDYGDWGVANKIINDLGRARYDNGWASAGFTKVYKRGDVGNTSCCNVYFYSGTSTVGGGRPGLVRHGGTAHLCYNSWTQVSLSADMVMDIVHQRSGARNIAIYSGLAHDYTALNPHTAGGEDGDIWVLWNWNFVTVSYIAPRWWR